MLEEDLIYNYDRHSGSHISIEASAGTGKTYTITKILKEFVQHGVSLKEIAVVTFTEKAAGELLDRIRKEFADDSFKAEVFQDLPHAVIGTIHSFCRVILRQYALEAERSINFEEIEDEGELFDQVFGLFWKRLENREPEKVFKILKKGSLSAFRDFIRGVNYTLKGRLPKLPQPPNENNLRDLFSKLSKLLPNQSATASGKKLFNFAVNAKFPDDLELFVKTFFTDAGGIRKNEFKELLKLADCGEEQLERLLKDLLTGWNYLNNFSYLEFLIVSARQFITDFGLVLKNGDYITRDDLIIKTRDLLRNNKIGEAVKDKYRYIIIDECQDTSPVQMDIFLSLFGNEPKGLILVGDPKQSIYRFLNADVTSYELAKEKIKGEILKLDKTWRMTPELISVLNLLFGNIQGLNHAIVSSARMSIQSKEKSPLLFLPESEGESSMKSDDIARSEAKRIAEAILLIIKPERGFTVFDQTKKEERQLYPGDIAIIYPKGSKKGYLIQELAKKGISVSVYKGNDLYRNSLVIAVSNLLNAIANPDDKISLYKALLSDLFLMKREDLAWKSEEEFDFESGNYEGEAFLNDPALDKIFLSLREAREDRYKKDISTIVISLFAKNNIIYHLSCGFEGRRNLANLYHLLELLATEQIVSGLSFDEIVEHLSENVKSGKDQEIKLDTEAENNRNVVKLMTVHAAKGLEFPVVIMYGMNIGDVKQRNNIFAEDKALIENEINIEFNYIDISTKNYYQNMAEEEKELFAEKKRLLYVALTRARDLLILPLSIPKENSLNSILFNALIENNLKDKLLQSGAASILNTSSEILKTVSVPQQQIDYDYYQEVAEMPSSEKIRAGITLNSYTSLSSHLLRSVSDASPVEIDYADREDQFVLDLYRRERKNTGRIFGDTCHKILEVAHSFNFSKLDIETELIKIAKEYYYKSGLLGDEGYELSDMINLCRLAITNKYLLRDEYSSFADWERIPEKSFYFVNEDKYYFGIGDLFFRYNGIYYILDWKTNKLNDYSREGLLKTTKDMYTNQINLYCYNLYLNLTHGLKKEEDKEKMWDEKFGGMIYVYLRGLMSNLSPLDRRMENEARGYVIVKPSANEMKNFAENYINAK